MATLYINEYSGILDDRVQIAAEPALATQTVAIGASHAESVAFTANTRFVYLSADAICSIAFGASPVATTGNFRLPANTIIPFAVPMGQSYKVSVITNT